MRNERTNGGEKTAVFLFALQLFVKYYKSEYCKIFFDYCTILQSNSIMISF